MGTSGFAGSWKSIHGPSHRPQVRNPWTRVYICKAPCTYIHVPPIPVGRLCFLLAEHWVLVPGRPGLESHFRATSPVTHLGCQGPTNVGFFPPRNGEDLAKLGLHSLWQQLAGLGVCARFR